MPEYLAPGVYLEEQPSANRPIEGVSTSTCGKVGVTERGPENVPVLCASVGDYGRVFGGALSRLDFTDPTGRVHSYLPGAVRAFFENGGRRTYVVRVASRDATHAGRQLFDRGVAGVPAASLLRAAPENSGTALSGPLVFVLQSAPPLAAGDTIRIGEGSRSEYRAIQNVGGAIHAALGNPLARAHAAGGAVEEVDRAVDATAYAAGTFTLAAAAAPGATTITVTALGAAADAVTILGLPGDALFEIGVEPRAEYRFATAADDLGGGTVRLTLAAPLTLALAAGVDVSAIELGAALTAQVLDTAAGAGESLIYLDALGGGFPNGAGTKLVVLEPGTPAAEVRRLGTLGTLTLARGAYTEYPAGARADLVAIGDDDRAVVGAGTPRAFTADRVDGLAVGQLISVDGNTPVAIDTIDATTGAITTRADATPANPAGGEVIAPQDKSLTAAAQAGAVIVALDNRLGLAADDVVRIGAGATLEYAVVAQVMGSRGVAPDAGAILFTAPLAGAHAVGDPVRRQTPPAVDPTRQAPVLVTGVEEGETVLLTSDAGAFAAADVVALRPPGAGVFYHVLDATDLALTAATLELDRTLNQSHDLGAPAAARAAMIDVVALDRGGWGNRLRIAVSDPEAPLVRATLTASSPINPLIELSNYTGVEAGTVLEFVDPATGQVVGTLAKVVAVDRQAGEVRLAAVPGPAVTGHPGPLDVRSREAQIRVSLLAPRLPGAAATGDRVAQDETFLVSMDPRHSRHLHRVIGTTWAPGADQDDDGRPLRSWDLRSEGGSDLIRVRDVETGNFAVTHSARLGPEPLNDTLVTGLVQPSGLAAEGGGDGVATFGPAMYQGVDDNEPRLRTGIFALQNQSVISIVAVPGQTGAAVQQALINHCERARYRFAILDGPPPGADTLVDVQLQRQRFDTNYAAIYHPWIGVPDLMAPPQVPPLEAMEPPSGYMAGIYARTDNERGVHKAPANTVVRSALGLARYLNQREQDILNPFPVNINVIRDFRRDNRGIRVWGARVITSASEFKFVNVRRLLIFIEASIERGLQYAVFEPNSEQLWATVRRSIGNFLTVVWRNGALEGTTPEQGFFVRCDRTTMTQTDIDEGRLIALVGVAPVKPAEFVIVRIGLKTLEATA